MKANTIVLSLLLVTFVTTAFTSSEFALGSESGRAIFSSSTAEPAQSSIRAHRQGKGVMISWNASGSSSVIGYEVERTYNDVSDIYAMWEQVSTVSAGSRRNNFHDLGVFPGVVSYRVHTVYQDGTRTCSEVATVRIVQHSR